MGEEEKTSAELRERGSNDEPLERMSLEELLYRVLTREIDTWEGELGADAAFA